MPAGDAAPSLGGDQCSNYRVHGCSGSGGGQRRGRFPLAARRVAGIGNTKCVELRTPTISETIPTLDWTACRDGFQCAKAAAPWTMTDRRGGDLVVVDPAAGGRPGAADRFAVRQPRRPRGIRGRFRPRGGKFLPLELRARFDLVGFDPRGVGRSTPLRCFDTFAEAVAVLPPMAFPVTPAEETLWRASDQALAAACADRGGAIQDHMSTANVARDMDLLRRAVGDDQLNYLGFSYGSYLGVTYANLFPDRVGALVVDGVLNPVAWSTGTGEQSDTLPFSTRFSDAGSSSTLGEFFRLCDAAGSDCPFAPNAQARYEALTQRALLNRSSWPTRPAPSG